jgi:hypothetical protein
VNRRQVDPVDRYALALLRAGQPHASQLLRADHGWEHDAATAAATRAAMADAAVADIVDHGAGSTVALVVSHGHAEDLADRIRRRLTVAGRVTGPALFGPGWTTDRSYQAGDRILFHARHGDRRSVFVNGTVATVTAVDRDGLTVPRHNHGRRRRPVAERRAASGHRRHPPSSPRPAPARPDRGARHSPPRRRGRARAPRAC